MDDAKILREANHVVSMPGNWHSANAEEYATRFARALIAAHERVRELEAKQAWQPIDSAPRDGTEIIVGTKGWASLAEWYCGGWCWGRMRLNDAHQPTHWMPLPEPPK